MATEGQFAGGVGGVLPGRPAADPGLLHDEDGILHRPCTLSFRHDTAGRSGPRSNPRIGGPGFALSGCRSEWPGRSREVNLGARPPVSLVRRGDGLMIIDIVVSPEPVDRSSSGRRMDPGPCPREWTRGARARGGIAMRKFN